MIEFEEKQPYYENYEQCCWSQYGQRQRWSFLYLHCCLLI